MSELTITTSAPPGAYPERIEPEGKWLDRIGTRAADPFLRWRRLRRAAAGSFVKEVASFEPWASKLDEGQVRATVIDLRAQLRRNGLQDTLLAQCFSLIREVANRKLKQRHFDTQILAGRMLLHGLVVEMETGEGKTLTATLAAGAAAIAGIPVHLITVNDYLARRDAEWMGPVYEALGLTVGTIVHGLDADQRRAAYRADIAYCTNKEIAFDYLKDRIALGREAGRVQLQVERLYEKQPRLDQLLLRGLFFAIVDEADSVLVDEARTPLIISGANTADSSEADTCGAALALASQMVLDRDFAIEVRDHRVQILPSGLALLEQVAQSHGGIWARRQWREEVVRQALAAQHLYSAEKQYLVRDGKIQIIDEYTGRVMEDRSWEHGLHQMIEVKEGCPVTRRIDPLARISYQRFFRRYLRLAGMTGTAREITGELWTVYRLATVRVPTNKPTQRRRLPGSAHVTQAQKWSAIVRRIEEIHALGRPILVGTRSVAASEHLSRMLTAKGLAHQLLNARQDSDEARIVAAAGEEGRITVATNMAGRGTDIRIGPEIAERGGLHVIATELHEASRIDRQLIGRCGRQGEPGTYEAITSIEDELVQLYSPRFWKALTPGLARLPRALFPKAFALRLRMAQRAAERLHLQMRRDLLKMDERLNSTLAFAGKSE